MTTRDILAKEAKKALKNLQKNKTFASFDVPEIKIEEPRQKNQGDYATPVALQIAGVLKRKPKTLAKIIRDELKKNKTLQKIVKDIRVAPPGFVNFYLSDNYVRKQVAGVLQAEEYGRVNAGRGAKLNLEFVSVNPTGELHVGHARTVFYGDVLARVLDFAGYKVTREYYINNARQSAQIKELGKTALGMGTSYKVPYLDKKIKENKKSLKRYKNPSSAGYFMARKIQKDIKKFLEKEAGVQFDVWYEEESLYKDGEIDRLMRALKRKKLVYENEGAIWLKTTAYGDTQDQVLVRSNGEYTYFASDIAYHRTKKKRGFKNIIDIWGSDHQGHVRRMKAAANILKVNGLEILIAQLVRLKGSGRLSKRAGNIVSVKDLINAVGVDAARYFYLTKSLDSQMEFDLSLATRKSQSNPVYYLQYTHARICSILKKSSGQPSADTKTLKHMEGEGELALAKKLTRFNEVIEDIANDYQVHRLANYVYELAQEFNRFYRDYKVLQDDENKRDARLVLTASTGVVIKKTLGLLGIKAPEKL